MVVRLVLFERGIRIKKAPVDVPKRECATTRGWSQQKSDG
jgi:hypothetical protein